MLLDSVRNLLGWHPAAAVASAAGVEPVPLLAPDRALADDDDPIWPSSLSDLTLRRHPY
jgi:hypothetical protein